MQNMTSKNIQLLLINSILFNGILLAIGAQENDVFEADMATAPSLTDCKEDSVSFEIVTGYVLTSPSDTMETIPGSVQLTDCLNSCRLNFTCKAVNFETGLCILLSSSSAEKPESLTPSQFPVFTIYAEKICLKNLQSNSKCPSASWAFERVIGFELRNFARKKLLTITKEECLEGCLSEAEFECRSLNYDNLTKECQLSNLDRRALQSNTPNRYFTPSSKNSDYYESNCIQEPKGLCDFRALKGKILKTVDSVHQEVQTQEECQQKCLDAPYRCFSYDFGDPTKGDVCRTSHLDTASLTHIEEPYLLKNSSTTYERVSCYNVSIHCRARQMIASVQTSKLFSGKIYAKTKPNSCVNDITNSLSFEIAMPYNDIMCDVKQKDQGKFTSDIIIQHHDMVVTTKDLGLSINCNYDLSNKSVTNKQSFYVEGDFDTREEANIHSQTVNSPNVTMLITDAEGNLVQAAQVGDRLVLRFSVIEESSPYQIFVRELVAVDGVDAADILLIDSGGCPTDSNIMGFVDKIGNGKTLEIPFDAFKFPTSDMVQFRALVTPCLHSCEPVHCVGQNQQGKPHELNSYGKRRRRRATKDGKSPEEEVVVIQSIRIMDSFGFQGKNKSMDTDSVNSFNTDPTSLDGGPTATQVAKNVFTNPCVNMIGITIACMVFVLIQLVLVLIWAVQWHKRNSSSGDFTKMSTSKLTGGHFHTGVGGGGGSGHHPLHTHHHLGSSTLDSSSRTCSPSSSSSVMTTGTTLTASNDRGHRYANFMKVQHE